MYREDFFTIFINCEWVSGFVLFKPGMCLNVLCAFIRLVVCVAFNNP